MSTTEQLRAPGALALTPAFEVLILSRKDGHRLHECDLHQPMPYWECRQLMCGLKRMMPALSEQGCEFYLTVRQVMPS